MLLMFFALDLIFLDYTVGRNIGGFKPDMTQ